MLKDITLGQYYPGNSKVHNLDPRVKILLTMLYIVLLFTVKNFTGFAVFAAFTFFVIYTLRHKNTIGRKLISQLPPGKIKNVCQRSSPSRVAFS